jgi:hypothetical protein
MDTQGCDRLVVAGATNSLETIVAIQSEIAVAQYYEGMWRFPDVIGYYMDLGFKPFGFFPLSPEVEFTGITEFDCVFVQAPSGR